MIQKKGKIRIKQPVSFAITVAALVLFFVSAIVHLYSSHDAMRGLWASLPDYPVYPRLDANVDGRHGRQS